MAGGIPAFLRFNGPSLRGAVFLVLIVAPFRLAVGDEFLLRQQWTGAVDVFATGAAVAFDGPDGDTTMVDQLGPASVDVTSADIPSSASLLKAFLYWGGSISQPTTDCSPSAIDQEAILTPPAGAPTTVTADVCYCSGGGASTYDIQVCRADVTSRIANMTGTYVFDGFNARITNSSTDNASFSIVIIYTDTLSPLRRVGLFDGVRTMQNSAETVTFANLSLPSSPSGKLTWYTLEGDVGGSPDEQVSVQGSPGGNVTILTDAVNPPTNPMNHTINTVVPARTDSLGVDIDSFDITGALSGSSTSVVSTYTAGDDKWWLAYQIIAVDTAEPDIESSPSSVQFGEVVVGSLAERTVTVSNRGNRTLNVTNIALDTPAQFSISSAPSPPIAVLPAGTIEIVVRFNPTETGTFSNSLEISSDDPDEQVLSISLNGAGVCSAVSITPAMLPEALWNTPYSQGLAATGATPPYAFSITAGALPAGISLSSAGLLSGSPTAVGSFQFTVQATGANGCSGTRDYALIVNPAATTTSLTSTPNPSVFGQTVTLTAAVTSPAGSPSGTVTFRDGAMTLGTSALSSGTAAFSTSSLSAGTHTISAEYGGDTNFSSSISPAVTHTVQSATVSLSSINPSRGSTRGGETLTLTGSNFEVGATVALGGVAATNVNIVNSTSLTATAPAHSRGAIDVTVTNTSGQGATLVNGYTYGTFDPDGDGVVTISDVFYLINHLFVFGPGPRGAAGAASGEANGDLGLSLLDVIYVLNYLFSGGPQPN